MKIKSANDIEASEEPLPDGNDFELGMEAVDSQLNKRRIHLQLYRAALSGDWEIAQRIYESNPTEINAKITKLGETALHIAAASKHVDFVKRLVNKMSKEDLALTDDSGNTAFCSAAISGVVDSAKAMMEKNEDLATTRGRGDTLPLYMAALLGHRSMVFYLYDVTKGRLEKDDLGDLLVTLIDADIYGVTLQMLEEYPDLAFARDGNQETALHAMARKSHMPSDMSFESSTGIWTKFINYLNYSRIHTKNIMHRQALVLVQQLWEQVISLNHSEISALIGTPWRLIFVAAEKGNTEFLTLLIRSYPDLVFKVDEDGRSIFHFAVLHRHEDIFKLIHEIGSNNVIAIYVDRKGNNILHLAGMLPPPSRLNVVPGAALQLQRELLWFEEVKKIVEPRHLEARNNKGETPRALFVKQHKGLMKEGEKWLRDTANSCMLVATLIATVVFAAAFTVPGGNGQDTGVPIFLQAVSFKIFAISDAVSLISSASSVLTFLSILTSRYAEDDFLWSLPNKLIIGLGTLFISVVAMMVAFMAAFVIVFKQGLLSIAIVIAGVASLPVLLFVWQHYRLFVDVIRSTYMSKSLFRPNKRHLFSARLNKSYQGIA